MKLGAYLRNMGPVATRANLAGCAQAAESAGLDDLWVVDHIAIPPDDAEGSGGRYLDPLATLAFLAGSTRRIGLGTAVLVLPYRPRLATAKWIATIQELSAERLLLGVGVGWMQAEFNAVGAERARRGRTSDETLEFLSRCFASDEVEENGQPFLFKPRPAPPPLFVGGAAPHATRRAARFGGGWMPMGRDAEQLAPQIAEFRELSAREGHADPEVALCTVLDLADANAAADRISVLAEIGVTRIVLGFGYEDVDGFSRVADRLGGEVRDRLSAAS